MSATQSEIILTTEASAQKWSVAAYDLHTGSYVRSFKGQAVAPGCLCVQANHTLMAVTQGKPVLQLWPLSRKDEAVQRIVCPGKVSALAVSPNGMFCVASIKEQVYIWELSAGGLLQVLDSFDEVRVIRFTDDGSHFITGSSSGNLCVWEFATVVSTRVKRPEALKHRFRLHAHSEPVTDIHVGCGGPVARVASCSSDRTCKILDLASGKIMKTLAYDEPVHSVLMDQRELFLFAGLRSGEIWCTPIYSQISQPEEFVSKGATKAGQRVFQGHLGPVSCLTLSSDGVRLASGSCQANQGGHTEGEVRIWNLESGDCITLNHGAAVTNILILPQNALNSAPSHQGPAISFQQQKSQSERGRIVNVRISDTSEVPIPDFSSDIASLLSPLVPGGKQKPTDSGEPMDVDTSEELKSLRKEVAKLKAMNAKLLEQSLKT